MTTITLESVTWIDPRAVALRNAMDLEMTALYAEELSVRSADEEEAVTKALSIDPASIVFTVIAMRDGAPVGHAALRPWGEELEVKKVFVYEEARGRGVSRALMNELERYAEERGIRSLVLQTGALQLAAIGLYEAMGYRPIDIYGPYAAVPVSRCYRKTW